MTGVVRSCAGAEPAPVAVPAMSHGLVIGKFYPPHAGHLALVRAALARCDRVTVLVLGSSQESIPAELRARWLRDELPGAHVVAGLDDEPVDYASETAWRAHTAIIENLLDAPVDALFSSDDYGEELARRLGARWVQVDPGRRGTPVSARAVRADPAAVLVGAAGGGARVVRAARRRDRRRVDGHDDARRGADRAPRGCRRSRSSGASGRQSGPAASRRRGTPRSSTSSPASRRASRTTPPPAPRSRCSSATPTCSRPRSGTSATSAVRRRRSRPSPPSRVPDLYLLTGDEIPFVQDGLRDGEHLRHAMQDRFREVLAAQDAPWVEVRGTPAERLAQALALVEPLRDRAAVARRADGAAPRGGS